MTEKNMQFDSGRYTRETVEYRAEEAKTRLISVAENRAVSHLVKLFGNGRINKPTEASLESTAGPTSDTYLFNGKIRVHALVEQNHGWHDMNVDLTVLDNNVDAPIDADLTSQIEVAQRQAEDVLPLAEESLEVPMDSFMLTDNGSPYLTVTHSSFHGADLGIVGKNEYATSKNKAALLKSIAEDSFYRTSSENHSTLSFVGEFKEPTIETVQEEAVPAVEKKASEEPKPEFVPADEVSSEADNLLASAADSTRQSLEATALRDNTAKDRLVALASNNAVSYLRECSYGSPRIIEVDASQVENTETGYTGTLFVSASLEDKSGLKIVSIPVVFADSKYTLPKKATVVELVTKAVNVHAHLEEKLAKEAIAAISEVDELELWKEKETEAAIEEPKIEKTAADHTSGTQYVGPMDTIKLQKHLIPNSPELEIGDVIFADGARWKLIDKSSEQLDKNEDSASLWTFAKVAETSDAKPSETLPR